MLIGNKSDLERREACFQCDLVHVDGKVVKARL